MATSISGNVRLVYGNHTHNETYSATSNAYTYTNPVNQYAAGSGRAVYHATTGTNLDVGTMDGAEGLLLIKNVNTIGKLLVSVDAGTNWDIQIPAGLVNLISVGPDHAIHVKTSVAQQTSFGVATVTSAGVITFDGYVATAGTYLMKATANPNQPSTSYIMKTTSDQTVEGTAYELDGITKKDLTTGQAYGATTAVTLDYIADYRYTLTEA